MSSIRSLLLSWLLLPLLVFILLGAFFLYELWQREIVSHFRSSLKAVTVATAEAVPRSDLLWVLEHRGDVDVERSEPFRRIQSVLYAIKRDVPLLALFLVEIEPVRVGEPVLLSRSVDDRNPLYDGKDSSLAFRQIYLVDGSLPWGEGWKEGWRPPGEMDFSESGEQVLYSMRGSMVSDGYTTRGDGESMMTAYASVLDEKGEVVALVGADLSLAEVENAKGQAFGIMALAVLTTLAFVTGVAVMMLRRIELPMGKIREGALKMASGDYGVVVAVEAPREIEELANTLNTMGACLKENLERVHALSTARERLIGTYECSLLLEERMMERPLLSFSHPQLMAGLVRTQLASLPHPVRVEISGSSGPLSLRLTEGEEMGFEGFYALLADPLVSRHETRVEIDLGGNRLWVTSESSLKEKSWVEVGASCLVWNGRESMFYPQAHEMPFFSGDLLLVCGVGLWEVGIPGLEKSKEEMKVRLGRVLRHFGGEEFSLLKLMLERELGFLAEKRQIDRDLFLLLFSRVS